MAVTRVHILATELGVKSTAIIEKCQAEGLDVKNHMSTISAGLAATIREWFSEGSHSTAIETAAPVDLKKVRVRRKKKKPAEVAAEPQLSLQQETVKEEGEEDQVSEPVQETVEAGEVAIEQPQPAEEAEETVKKEVGPVILPPLEPVVIVPAGPMLGTPTPVKLNGPRIVRVEKVEPLQRPRPHPHAKPPARPRYDQPITERLAIPAKFDAADKAKAKGKKSGVKDKTHGRRKDAVVESPAKQPKLVKKFREKDLEERRARIDAAQGESLRLRPSRKIETHKHREAAVVRPEKATVSEPITVKNLSAAISVKTGELISKLIAQGVTATVNQVISAEVAEIVALEFGTELTVERRQSLEDIIRSEFENRPRANLKRRPVVVTMLGHVDHGKTSLLDRIRSANVAAGEAGGITQHIGAYQVDREGRKVTFLDTPGHEAFTAMRARGANMTDVAVLVVAADDGLMPQTIEAIHHAKAANVQIIVALNKIDLPGVDINRIYGQLAEQSLAPTEWSGTTEVVKTSAVTGQGITDLIEHLDYIADLAELKADDTIPATGWVIEAKMTQTQGAVATVLIKEGVLSKGDVVLAGTGCGRIRTMRDSFGKSIKTAVSSMPVEISGLSDVPQAGDRFYCLDNIDKAKQAAEENKMRSREDALARRTKVTLENLFSHIAAGKVKELNLIVRADVQGSVDVLIKYLNELSTDEVKIRILHAAVGGITEGDVVLAEASEAIIIGFNVVPDDRAGKMAESKGIDVRLYNIIYRITEDLKKAMSGLLEPEEQEKNLGKLTVRNTFKVTGVGTVAGCYVTSGLVAKNAKLRLIRNNIVVKDNCSIESLKHFKDDVREVKNGLECGIKIAGFDDIKVDDAFEAYEIIKVSRQIV